ncbi:MAG: 4-hydroxy-tetrahydrodipicolinate reductase [Nakamurella sp.]
MTGRLRVAVIGAAGRMGSEACAAVDAADDLDLVARLGSEDSRDLLVSSGAVVAVDLTRPDAVMETVRFCVSAGIHLVIGTSGVDADRLAEITALLGDAPSVGVVVVPNFAIGAVLAMRFARQAASFFAGVEVVELHHAGKADAPSGTAAATARGIAAARAAAGSAPMPDATVSDPSGARGGVVDGVHVHSVRLPGLVAHQEVLLGGEGELLTIRHDSLHRASFMPGVLLALRQAPQRPGLTQGLEPLLDLD